MPNQITTVPGGSTRIPRVRKMIEEYFEGFLGSKVTALSSREASNTPNPVGGNIGIIFALNVPQGC